MATKSSRRLTEQERAERRCQDRERLQRAAEELLTSEGWKRWLRVRSQAGLARLSISNQLLVALARPDANSSRGSTPGFGWAMRSGRGSARWRSSPLCRSRSAIGSTGEETGDTMLLFKTVFVFDRAQVDPIAGREQAPLGPPCEPLTGDSHAHLLAPIRVFAESLGFSVSFESIPGETGGWCDPRARRIVVDADAPANAQLRILVHETVHALGVGYAEYGRQRAEVIVDTATAIACASVGLRVDGDSIPYTAGWGEMGELDAVTAFAKTIDELARQIENVLTAASTTAQPAAAETSRVTCPAEGVALSHTRARARRGVRCSRRGVGGSRPAASECVDAATLRSRADRQKPPCRQAGWLFGVGRSRAAHRVADRAIGVRRGRRARPNCPPARSSSRRPRRHRGVVLAGSGGRDWCRAVSRHRPARRSVSAARR